MTRNEEKANVLAEHLGIKNGIIVNSGTIAFSNSATVSKELLKAGIGIGYINEEIVRDEIEKGNLCIISSKTTADIYSVNVAMQNKNNNFVIKEFIKCLKGVLTEND